MSSPFSCFLRRVGGSGVSGSPDRPPKFYLAEDDLESPILLPLVPKGWDFRLVPLCLALCTTFSILVVLSLPDAATL